ncbi:hypothetical protein Q5P01_000241 [Channa striata]|uniref:Uncharacterized protein n=1 Tax=Channa striata TaxID=64152 RepID=A0AA88IZF6_CHASR|nr:hypothetical protein Q5P01_000241 [Channa striata]
MLTACSSPPPADFISHSFSVAELQFLFQNVPPDLSGRVLGAVQYGGCVYSSASQLISVDLSEAFVQMQNNVLLRFRLNDRVQLIGPSEKQGWSHDIVVLEAGGDLGTVDDTLSTQRTNLFLCDDEQVDALCEAGTMSRTYCVNCGSSRTLDPLGDFISHSFSVSELQFLFHNVLPDLSGRVLGAVLYGGCVYSSASQLISVDLSEAFVQMQNNVLLRFRLNDRVQLIGPSEKQGWSHDIVVLEAGGDLGTVDDTLSTQRTNL